MFEKARGGIWTSLTALGAAAALLTAGTEAAPVRAKPAAARPVAVPNLNGVWEMKFREYIRMDDGKLPPFSTAGEALYKNRVAKMEAGEQLPDSATACLPHGTPRIMYTPYPMLIAQQPNLVAFMFEVNHNIRVAYLNDKLPVDPDPTYAGYTVAHWEGQELVMDTNGLNDKIQIDRAGLPQSSKTTINERLSLIEGGKRMKNIITVTDPTLYTRPWSFTVFYKRVDYKIMEYVCDNNRPIFYPPAK